MPGTAAVAGVSILQIPTVSILDILLSEREYLRSRLVRNNGDEVANSELRVRLSRHRVSVIALADLRLALSSP